MYGGGKLGKAAINVVLGTTLAVLSLPVTMLLATAVCLSLRTWRPIFLQERVGLDGCSFTFPKLRTLPRGSPATADKYTIAITQTTRLGRFLRRTHLDELPQLLLVPMGRMSLVGPRPEMPTLLTAFDSRFVAARSAVRPGCTGLWQIGADAGRLIGEAPEYDLYYIRHARPRLDLWIFWRSVLVMLGGQPISLADVPTWAQRRGPVICEATDSAHRAGARTRGRSTAGKRAWDPWHPNARAQKRREFRDCCQDGAAVLPATRPMVHNS